MAGRVTIVAGGSGALGQSICLAFLSAGDTVCLPFAVAEETDALRARLGPAEAACLDAAPCDVTDEAAVNRFVAGIVERHGRVDALVNAVGGFAGGDLASTSVADWNRMLTLNLNTAMLGCRAVLPAMTRARRGRIVNIASRAVVPPQGGFIAYTVSKAAVITLTQALAQEVRAHGITVNAVLPSTMDTPANRRAMPDADRSSWVTTDSVALVVSYLASDAAASVSGAAVPV
jgi:NAD(P)-dependent dehydrogenase (short-subunit alcohol dehydrogenase family)